MQLINYSSMDVRTMQSTRIVCFYFEVAPRCGVQNLTLTSLKMTLECRRAFRQHLNRLEKLVCLIPFHSRSIDLASGREVGGHHIDSQAATKGRLAILARHINVQVSYDSHKIAKGISLTPTKYWGENIRYLP